MKFLGQIMRTDGLENLRNTSMANGTQRGGGSPHLTSKGDSSNGKKTNITTNDRKLWRAMTAHVLMGYGWLMISEKVKCRNYKPSKQNGFVTITVLKKTKRKLKRVVKTNMSTLLKKCKNYGAYLTLFSAWKMT